MSMLERMDWRKRHGHIGNVVYGEEGRRHRTVLGLGKTVRESAGEKHGKVLGVICLGLHPSLG